MCVNIINNSGHFLFVFKLFIVLLLLRLLLCVSFCMDFYPDAFSYFFLTDADILPHTLSSIGGAVLGARWMQKYYTVFDRANKRVGFSPAFNCTGARYQLVFHIIFPP